MSGSNGGDDGGDEELRAQRAARRRERMVRLVRNGEVRTDGNPHIPPGAPFVPLGNMPGMQVALLDSHGAFQRVTARDLSRNNIQRMFSATPRWLFQMYPRMRKGQNAKDADSFHADRACGMILDACGHEGPWEPSGRLRGRGAWPGEDGDLVLHCGDTLWIRGQLAESGQLRAGIIYPHYPPIMRPHESRQGVSHHGPGEQLQALLQTFNFARSDFDVLLVLGWIAAAMIGGALPVRPALWFTGNRGTGKTTLVKITVSLFGPGGCISSSNTTAAGIWQSLGEDCLPVVLDETEPTGENSKRLNGMIELMRVAFSGGDVKRGSPDSGAHDFPLRSAFLFSSINVPSMRPQDRSRTVIIDLNQIDDAATPPNLGGLEQLGRAILRRMADQYPRLMGELIPEYRRQLLWRGFDSRGADTYGVLLACGAALMNDDGRDAVQHHLNELQEDIKATVERHREEETPDWVHCIEHLRGQLVDPYRNGERRPIGELIRRAAGYAALDPSAEARRPAAIARTEQEAMYNAAQDQEALDASRALMAYGMRLVLATPPGMLDMKRQPYVAVANQNPALQELFRNTHWAGVYGGSSGWRQPLQRAPGALVSMPHVYFRDGKQRAVHVPLGLFLGLDPDETVQ